MGIDFSGFIKIYLHKFNEEIKEAIKDKSIKEKESIFLEKLTSLFLSKYIILIYSEKNLNPYFYLVNICESINKNLFLKIYFHFLDNLINNEFSEKISKISEKDDDIFKIMNSLTEEFKDVNIKDIDSEKYENDLYSNNGSNIVEFYATVFKAGIDFLASKRDNYLNIISKLKKSCELLNIGEKRLILIMIIEAKNIDKSNYIQHILILILLQIKKDDKSNLNELIENNKISDLIEILERVKDKGNELDKESFESIIKEINSEQNLMNIEDLIENLKML